MRLRSVVVHRIRIPFRQAFRHASAERLAADNLVVRCEAEDGSVGWGETIAREYVTGDKTEGVRDVYRAIPKACWSRDVDTLDDVRALAASAGLDEARVARCGVELALVDLLARRQGLPLFAFLAESLPALARVESRGPFFYAGPLGLSSPRKTAVSALKLRLYRFRSVKLKLGGTVTEDARRVRLARAVLGRGADLRVDANEAWSLDHALALAPTLRACAVSGVEQPFPKTEGDALAEFHRRTGLAVILDESLLSEEDARRAVASALGAVFAVKLAKLGGFLETLRILAVARQSGVPVQISCQVGESAILSAAGRHLAALTPNLIALEGSYDRFLLRDNVTAAPVAFGYGGRAPLLFGAGLGIDVDPARVERLSVERLGLM